MRINERAEAGHVYSAELQPATEHLPAVVLVGVLTAAVVGCGALIVVGQAPARPLRPQRAESERRCDFSVDQVWRRRAPSTRELLASCYACWPVYLPVAFGMAGWRATRQRLARFTALHSR
jgi:hypothetical protein